MKYCRMLHSVGGQGRYSGWSIGKAKILSCKGAVLQHDARGVLPQLSLSTGLSSGQVPEITGGIDTAVQLCCHAASGAEASLLSPSQPPIHFATR